MRSELIRLFAGHRVLVYGKDNFIAYGDASMVDKNGTDFLCLRQDGIKRYVKAEHVLYMIDAPKASLKKS